MRNADELRKIALEKQECDYLYHLNDTICRIDEIIENRAENGWTWLFLIRRDKDYIHNSHVFRWINKEMFKELKKYYKKKGFKIGKSIFNRDIYIEW